MEQRTEATVLTVEQAVRGLGKVVIHSLEHLLFITIWPGFRAP